MIHRCPKRITIVLVKPFARHLLILCNKYCYALNFLIQTHVEFEFLTPSNRHAYLCMQQQMNSHITLLKEEHNFCNPWYNLCPLVHCRGLKKKQRFSLWRQKFMAGLHSRGLEIEEVREIHITHLNWWGVPIRSHQIEAEQKYFWKWKGVEAKT